MIRWHHSTAKAISVKLTGLHYPVEFWQDSKGRWSRPEHSEPTNWTWKDLDDWIQKNKDRVESVKITWEHD